MASGQRRPGITPDKHQAQVVRAIADMYLRGMAMETICRELERQGIPAPKGGHKWHANVIRTILRSPLHAGLIRHDGEYIQAAHYPQRIYDPEVFHQIQDTMRRRRRFGPRTLSCPDATLSMVITCDECDERAGIIHRGGPYWAYRCDSPRRRGKTCISRPYVRHHVLEPRVVHEIARVAQYPEVLAAAEAEAKRVLSQTPGDLDVEARRLRSDLTQIEARREELSRAFGAGDISLDMIRAYDRMAEERGPVIRARLADVEALQVNTTTLEAQQNRALDLLRDFPRLWRNMRAEEKRTVFEMLIESLRIGRVDGWTRVKLKIRFLDEIVFDLPVHSQWKNARKGIPQPPVSLRQLAYLALVAEGYSDKQIRDKWQVKRANVSHMRRKAISGMGVTTVEEAVEKARPLFQGCKDSLPLGPLHGRAKERETLSAEELAVLKGIAAGHSMREIADKADVPKTSIEGRLARAKHRLRAESREEAVAKATALGLIGPQDRSPAMLLAAYERLAAPEYADLRKQHGIKIPTERQMECLRALADGLNLDQTAKRMKIGGQAVVYMRARVWRVVGASSLRTALERVQELGLVPATGDAVA